MPLCFWCNMTETPNDDTHKFWQVAAEKEGVTPIVARAIIELRDGQRGILEELASMKRDHVDAAKEAAQFRKAFPAEDLAGHCRYHQILIDALDEKRKLRIAIKEKTIAGLVWAAALWLAHTAWAELLRLLGKS